MKIGSTGRPARTRPTSKTTSASAAAAYSSVSAPRTIIDTTSIMGIPEAELTPKVRDAIMTLMEEVDTLRRSVEGITKRLENAERLADQDSLLPLYNRRAFVRELTRVQATVERYGTAASLIYIDLDGFKEVNDTYGHQAGDYVLSEIALRLAASVRETDIVGRLGGDEFGLILSRTDHEAAATLTTRFPAELERNPIFWEGTRLNVGMSYGIVPIEAGVNAEQALNSADGKMYQHKKVDKGNK
ncbi:MAG: GGDEF domain-containing protein [Sneathiella sp.]|nr:GGDEF domain-containing protein [Sneathiella sp.]